MKKILVFLGHTNKTSFSATLAEAYERAAQEAGNEVERINISDLQFDPVLYEGYKKIQKLEPDLVSFQEKILWADHIVFVYPNWWLSMPALMKGVFDRMWLPGFAFNFDHESKKIVPHLKGKTARVIIVSGTNSPLMTWWKFGDYTNEIVHGILGFSGIKAKVTPFGPSEKVKPDVLLSWTKKVQELGKKGI